MKKLSMGNAVRALVRGTAVTGLTVALAVPATAAVAVAPAAAIPPGLSVTCSPSTSGDQPQTRCTQKVRVADPSFLQSAYPV